MGRADDILDNPLNERFVTFKDCRDALERAAKKAGLSVEDYRDKLLKEAQIDEAHLRRIIPSKFSDQYTFRVNTEEFRKHKRAIAKILFKHQGFAANYKSGWVLSFPSFMKAETAMAEIKGLTGVEAQETQEVEEFKF